MEAWALFIQLTYKPFIFVVTCSSFSYSSMNCNGCTAFHKVNPNFKKVLDEPLRKKAKQYIKFQIIFFFISSVETIPFTGSHCFYLFAVFKDQLI